MEDELAGGGHTHCVNKGRGWRVEPIRRKKTRHDLSPTNWEKIRKRKISQIGLEIGLAWTQTSAPLYNVAAACC